MLPRCVKRHIDHQLSSCVAHCLFFCFHINIEAQTFFWLSGNGDCSEVVDDVVKSPSLLYVLLQHRHTVFNEDLEPGRPEGEQVLFASAYEKL